MPKHLTFFLESLPSSHQPFWAVSSSRAAEMKSKASVFLKQVFSALVAMVKAKSMAVKSKTNAIKARLMILRLLRNKNVIMTTISHKIHELISHDKAEQATSDGGCTEDNANAIVLYNTAEADEDTAPNSESAELVEEEVDEEEEDDEYPGDGAKFKLEDDIDHVADVFIRRFHKQMRLQKQESFKRYKEMLERSV